jgi:hypothetical protein
MNDYYWVGNDVFVLFISGCQSDKPMTLEEIYPGEISDVTKMEIRHGGGKLQTITSPTLIKD